MIVYREFSSLIHALGFSGKALYSVSNNIHRHYRAVQIPKNSGGFRQLHIPDAFLKAIQRSILNNLLLTEDISSYASAYLPGGSTKRNARVHLNKSVVLKLDILNFFDRLIFPLVKEKAFPSERYSEQNRVLLTALCIFRDSIPQGAPTSPAISNIIMRDFDDFIGNWAADRGISYSRYCDDMTFSGDFDPDAVIPIVKNELRKMGLYLNERKTVIARKGQQQQVTGIIVNEKISVPAEYKAKIRQEMYYCMKYGIEDHLRIIQKENSPEEYRLSLLGRINYVLNIEPGNLQMANYRRWLTDRK